ncbi:MAG: hypothetical protein JW942_03265 [Opitutales bacterium]|nr:hypothetical protein [Opitutales bacterium]
MILEHFDEGPASAVMNMALDLLLLESYPAVDALRLRHYGWTPDCFSFGYSQKEEWIRAQCPQGAELARRPTGGGLVDHRNDWTFAFVLPASHPMHHAPAIDVYRAVHQAIADAMTALGRPACLQPEEDETPSAGMPKRVRGLCFAGAEPCDVIDPKSRVKIAGAAMKRNKCGVLLQGSIDRLVTGALDWAAFRELFIQGLQTSFGAWESRAVPSPSYDKAQVLETAQMMSQDKWLRRR